jgi:outer membrane biosynthesis protein TonB
MSKHGDKPVMHVSVQAIGNRATDEGKAALDAAHTVADGGDPAAAFAALATTYAASPMAWAYKTRAGTEGPGYMIGSGVGAVLAVAAVAVPIVIGKRNAALAEDLGVKPEEPPPELKPTTAPKRPKTTPAAPKKDPSSTKKPVEPKPVEPKPDEPKDDPIVEPKRPLPPKPEPDPTEPKEPGLKKKPKHLGKGRPRPQ